MRPGPSVIRACVLLSATVALVLVFAILPVKAAMAEQLVVTPQKWLSLVGESEAVTVEGSSELISSDPDLTDASIVIRLRGPAGAVQIGTQGSRPEVAAEVSHALSPETDLAADGSLRSRIVISFSVLTSPGAYLAEVDLVVGGDVLATGTVWFGKVADGSPGTDIALVWPLTLGIHRDAEGAFFDNVLEEAVSADAEGAGVAAFADAAALLPQWSFTLAVEPVSLTQLRDMSDGYVRLGPSGEPEEVGPETAEAQGAAEALADLSRMAGDGAVEVVTMPFAGASVDLLATKGWRDGLQQVQLGKQVVQQTLALSSAVSGVYASDLDITTAGVGSYGQASVDNVIVGASVAEDLAERPDLGAVTARVRDLDNQRVTLVFADPGLQALMKPPWDPGVFCAGLAEVLASTTPEALVLTPVLGSGIPPASYLETVGRALERIDTIRDLTLSELVYAHSPGSRPVLLERESPSTAGYIGEGLQASIDAAHQAAMDIEQAAGPTVGPVADALALLYTAQSRWWSLPGTSPAVASIGLTYAEKARRTAEAELAKLSGVRMAGSTVVGSSGEMTLTVKNDAAYKMGVEVELVSDGCLLPGGSTLTVDLAPGNTDVPITVEKTRGTASVKATVRAGSHVVGTAEASARFLTVLSFVPWAVGAVVIVAAVVGAVFASRRRRNRKSEREA